MENIRGLTVKNSKELDKYSVVFKQIGIEGNSNVGSTFDIDKSIDSIVVSNRETLIGFIFTPMMESTVGGNALDIFLTTDLLKSKSIYTISDLLIQLVLINNTPSNRIVDIGVYIINEDDFISLSIANYIENRQIITITGFLEYVKVLIDKDMIKTTNTDGVSYYSNLENDNNLNKLIEEMLIGETNINNIE